MKKLILLLLCAVSSFSLATTQASDGSNLRDSIFRIYRSMPADTARTQFLKDLFVRNIDKDWSAELLDSALASAISMKDVESELALRYEYFRYYTFRLDGENMDKALALLKEVCYRSKIYDNYFSALHYMLQLKGSRGDTESAILESQKMREEAIQWYFSRYRHRIIYRDNMAINVASANNFRPIHLDHLSLQPSASFIRIYGSLYFVCMDITGWMSLDISFIIIIHHTSWGRAIL